MTKIYIIIKLNIIFWRRRIESMRIAAILNSLLLEVTNLMNIL